PEALYFDKSTNTMQGGNLSYLRGDNAPWLAKVDYHAPQSVGARAYLSPQAVFDEEMNGALDAFRKAKAGTSIAYSIGTSGLGTRGGADAIQKYMLAVEKLCERLVYEKRGRVRITLTTDHGHTLTECKRTKFEETLKKNGFRLSDSLSGPND